MLSNQWGTLLLMLGRELHTQLLLLLINYCSHMHHPENGPQWAFSGLCIPEVGSVKYLYRKLEKAN